MKTSASIKPPTRRKAQARRARAPIVRVLRPPLPALSKKYNFRSFGIFGSYARGQQKGTSDLDVLVEYYDTPSISQMLDFDEELSALVGKKVDSHQPQNLKTYIGKNVMRQAIWLQKDGVVQKIPSSRRTGNGKRNRGSMEPEREYLDFMEDMVVCMENAPRQVDGMTYEQMLADRKTKLAVRTEVMMIGEAASRIPRDIQARYPEIPWKDIIGSRHRAVHGYDRIDYKESWKILHESIPHDLPRVRAMLDAEKKRRNIRE